MQFLKYFIYLAWNWNLPLAWFMIRHEMKGEKKYGLKTVGINNLKSEIPSDKLLHASVYQPINYYSAEQLFEQTYLEDIEGVLLDMGCGKGRIFGVAAAYGFTRMIGVDFSAQLCKEALETASEVKSQYEEEIDIQVVYESAADYAIPTTVNTIFLFNPFDEFVMRSMLLRLTESLAIKHRPIKILYANPVCKNLFLEAGYVETFYFKKMTYLEGSVLEKQ